MSHWHRHPGVRSGDELTRGERAADVLRNSMGSWAFVFGFLAFMCLWAVANSVAAVFGVWDAYPFILLNLFLSMLAGLQGAILLIAAKRQDQISSELALHDYQTNVHSEELLEAVHELTREIHANTVKPAPAKRTRAPRKPKET
jgi:uncharacterized membrane protein